MLRYNEFINEAKKQVIVPEIPNTMNFWHGGTMRGDDITFKNGRCEFGAGLYMTNHLDTALKYAKGTRKLHLLTVEIGNDIEYIDIDLNKALEFVDNYVIKSKQKDVIQRINNFVKADKINGNIFDNIITDGVSCKPSNYSFLRGFYVDNGIDYRIVKNAFGWHETMLILYNMDKLKKVQTMTSNDDYYEVDLMKKAD